MHAEAILAAMIALVPPANQKQSGEAEPAARARYAVIANAIALEAKGDARLARFLIVTARHESSFAVTVHRGTRRGDGGRSWGLYQINCGKRRSSKCPRIPFRAGELVGTSKAATARATKAGALHLRKHVLGCKGAPRCVFRGYVGAPRGPMSKRVAGIVLPRVTTYRRILWLEAKARKSPQPK